MTDNQPPAPKDPNAPELRPHVYDGIQEYDQKLPNWWLYTFYGAIVWFVVYWFLYYQTSLLETDHERITKQIGAIQAVKAKELEALLTKLDDKVLWDWSKNAVIKEEGHAIYNKYCFTCHAQDLSAMQGGVKLPGESLLDEKWMYGRNPMDLLKLVSKGTPDKSKPVQMPPWEAALSGAEIAKVVAFVLSHHEQNAPAVPAVKP